MTEAEKNEYIWCYSVDCGTRGLPYEPDLPIEEIIRRVEAENKIIEARLNRKKWYQLFDFE